MIIELSRTELTEVVAELLAASTAKGVAIGERLREVLADPDPMPVFAIKAKDALAPDAIGAYRHLCLDAGLADQALEVDKAIVEVVTWQFQHQDAVKLPDHRHVPAS